MAFGIIIPAAKFAAANIIGRVALPHRFFRINILAVSDPGFISISEIQIADAIGGPSIAGGAAITASADAGAQSVIGNAFDGSFASNWDAPAPSQSVILDFGDTARAVQEVRIAPRGGLEQRAPTSLQFQFSDDGATWTTDWGATATAASYADGAFTSFARPISS